MYKTSLSLPANLNEWQTAILVASGQDLCDSYSALRENNVHTSPWVLEWLSTLPVDIPVLKARIEIAANVHEIALPEPLAFLQEELQDRDWLSYSYKQFPPFSVGPFFIYGSHYEGQVPDGQYGLQIDAATAFGSGEHGTTKGCLQAMLDLKGLGACPWNVLDMGTGSGILAIAAWKLWKTPVLAVDNDPESVRVAARHGAANNVPDSASDLRCRLGDGFHEETVQRRKPFDLIIANILPGPLKEMAADLVHGSDENGYVILSGILNEQAEDVLGVYTRLGLQNRKTLQNGEWTTLMLQNTSA